MFQFYLCLCNWEICALGSLRVSPLDMLSDLTIFPKWKSVQARTELRSVGGLPWAQQFRDPTAPHAHLPSTLCFRLHVCTGLVVSSSYLCFPKIAHSSVAPFFISLDLQITTDYSVEHGGQVSSWWNSKYGKQYRFHDYNFCPEIRILIRCR